MSPDRIQPPGAKDSTRLEAPQRIEDIYVNLNPARIRFRFVTRLSFSCAKAGFGHLRETSFLMRLNGCRHFRSSHG
jgi:hypothetical protein